MTPPRILRRALTAVVSLVVVVAGSATPFGSALADPRTEPIVMVRGRVVAMAGDPRTPVDGHPIQRYAVATRDGVVPLDVDAVREPAVLAVVGARVAVAGSFAGERLQVRSLRPIRASVRSPQAVTGSQKWATLLCRFAGNTTVPHAKAWYEGLVGSADSLVSDYFEETSYGAVDLAGGKVMDWVDLPHDRAYYGPAASADLSQMAQDCADASDTAGLDFRDYKGIDMHFNENMTYSWGGTTYLSFDGATRIWSATWMSDWGNFGVQGHEMGHGLGLLHSSGPYSATYDSRWDQMSYAYAGPVVGTYGNSPEGTIAYHRQYLGWFNAAWITTVNDGGSATVTLRPLSDPAAVGGDREIVIPVSQYVSYSVEARERTGADQGVPGDAVVIHQVDEARRFSSPYDRIAQVVDVDGNGNVNDAGAMWTVGETFTDAGLDLSVSVDSKSGDGSYQVTVVYGAPDSVDPTNPTSFSSSSHTVGQWSADDTIRVTFSGAGDVGTGVHGYSVAWGGAGVSADTTEDLDDTATAFTSPAQPDGDRYVALRTVDGAGNWSGQIVAGPFRIDRTNPEAVVVADPSDPFTWATSIPVTWSGTDGASGVAAYDARYRTSVPKSDFGPRTPWISATADTSATLTGIPGRTYCIDGRSVDAVGNVGAWGPEACTAVPLDDHALVHKGAWTEATGGAFEGSVSTATARGARLVLKKVQARRFGVMATTCPTCGKVRVLFRGVSLGTIDLSATPGQGGAVFSLGTTGPVRKGSLVLEVRSKHRPVTIDAVGLTRV